MLLRAPYTLPFFLAIWCWIKHNDAIPLATYSSAASRIQDIFKEKTKGSENSWNDTLVYSRVRRQAVPLNFDSESDETINNSNDPKSQEDGAINRNKTINVSILGLHKSYAKDPKLTMTTTEESTSLSKYQSLEDIKEEPLTNCSSNRKKNQRYTSSFVRNTTSNLNVDEEFDKVFGDNSKAKRISSVHEGEDITLCWIETTTIKENKTVRPSKRLVIREYTISFENSATIPDRYLECKRLEGELAANDLNVGKTTLFEVIDEDTKISKVVNFTSISHVGDIIVWQHKRVKCGVGPVATKNIIEWSDGTKNPKKRVEIMISPKLRSTLTAAKTEEESCTEEGEEVKDGSTDSVTESCENTEGSTPEVTTTTDGISTGYEISTTESIITEPTSEEEESEEKISLPVVNVASSTSFISEEAESTTETFITTSEKLDCEKNPLDPACIIQEFTIPSSKESSTELSITTEATATSEATFSISTPVSEVSTLIDEDKITEKKLSSENIQFMITEPSAKSSESVSETTTEETILPTSTTGASTEFPETHTSQRTVESTSKELNKTDHIASLGESTISSSKIGIEQDTAELSFTKFPKESEISEIFDKISKSSILSQSIIEKDSEIKKTTTPEIKSTTLPPTTSGEIDYSCENCVSSSEGCKFENCSNTTIKSCESEVCPEEEITEAQSTFGTPTSPAITTQPSSAKPTEIETERTSITTISSREDEKFTTIDNVFTTTLASRRSTIISRHKLTLKIKILLEHIGENEEKQNLVEVEKQLPLDENPYREHSDLIERLKSLNDTVNMETINALLNCTNLSNLAKNENLIRFTKNNLKKSEYSADFEDSISIFGQTDDKYENTQHSEDDQEAAPQRRRRRSVKEVFDSKIGDLNSLEAENFLDSNNSAETKYQNNKPRENINDKIKMEVARQTLPGIQKDVLHGLQHVAARLTRKNLINDVKKMTSTNLLDVIADPKDNRIHSRKRRATMEEVGHWSNERIKETPIGGSFRSFTEFILYEILYD